MRAPIPKEPSPPALAIRANRERCVAESKAMQSSGRDWVEDFTHENGNYLCRCSDCGNRFFGHKRRVTCKECAKPVPATRFPFLDGIPAADWLEFREIERQMG